MSVGLVREVIEHAPADVSAAEYVVLLMIAEKSQEKSHEERGRIVRARECFPSREDLARDCHQSTAALEKILQRLAHRGLEVRVPIGTDKHGKPYFARAGVRTTYRLPTLPVRADRIPGSLDGDGDTDVHNVTAGRTGFRPEVGQDSGRDRTGFRAKPGQDSGPNQNVTRREPEREPDAPAEHRRGRVLGGSPAPAPGPLSAMGSRTLLHPDEGDDEFVRALRTRLPDITDQEIARAIELESDTGYGTHQIANRLRTERKRTA